MHIQRKLKSDHICPEKGSKQTWEDLKLILQADPIHRDSYNNQNNKSNEQKQPKTENPKEERESELHSYHILDSHAHFSTKKLQGIQRNRKSMAHQR